jgi:hypothetical protein
LDRAGLTTFATGDYALPDAIERNTRLLVRVAHGLPLSSLILEIAALLGDRTLAVCTTQQEHLQRNGMGSLRSSLRNEVGWIDGGTTTAELDRRVIIGRPQALMQPSVELERRDLVMFPDAFDTAGSFAQHRTQAVRRCVGCVPADWHIAPYTADLLRGCFGFNEITLLTHGQQPLPVDVVFMSVFNPVCPLPTIYFPEDGPPPVALRRDPNSWIGRVARALATLDRVRLRVEFPEVSAAFCQNTPARVAVLVDDTARARELVGHLPRAAFVIGEEPRVPPFLFREIESPERIRAAFEQSGILVVTKAGLRLLDWGSVDVLVRADVDNSSLLGERERLVVDSASHRRLLLIDCCDLVVSGAPPCSHYRHAVYADWGWYEARYDPVQERVREFLATRPR